MGNSRASVSIDDLPKSLQQRARAIAIELRTQPKPFVPDDLGPNALISAASNAPRARKADLEHPIQVEVVAWADDPATLPQYPELKALYSIPNEVGDGSKRALVDGARKKASGRRKGMPDLCLPTPRRVPSAMGGTIVSGALYLEMKDESGTVRKAQRERIAALRAAGNRCEIAMSADVAKAIITAYLQLPRP